MRADIWMERRTRRSDDWTLTDADELPVFPALRDAWSEANRAASPPALAPRATVNPFTVSPERRIEIAERNEYDDAFLNGGGSMAPPPIYDSSLTPKCLTPDGEREELERRFGRPVTDQEVRQHREATGMAGSRDAFDHDRKEVQRLYRDGSQQTAEERERELNARAFANLRSGPFAAMAYSAAGVFTPDPETKMWASGAMAALEQAAGSFALGERATARRPGQPASVAEPRAVEKAGRPTDPHDPIGDRGLANRGYRPAPGERKTSKDDYNAGRSAERSAAKFRPAKGGAASAANAERHKKDLAMRQASGGSPFARDGGLKPDAIAKAHEITPGNNLKNPEVRKRLTRDGSKIEDWGKYSTESFDTPSGPYQVHFYYNPKTGKVDLEIDYKAVRNDQGKRR